MKTQLIAFSALLSFAAVAGAEDRAPQLQPIDAGTVWNQVNNNQHPFPRPALDTLDMCRFKELKGKVCYFLCESGAILTEPAVRPEFPSADPHSTEACSFYIVRPIPAAQVFKAASPLDASAAREIAAIAKTPAAPFGAIDGGNLGLSAYRLTPDAANLTVALVKAAFPGINLGNRVYTAAGNQLILVITSDDEAYVHMYDQNPASGRLTRIDDFNSVDAVETFYGNSQMAALAAGYEEFDWGGVLQGLAGKGRGTPVQLGKGSARPYWWAANKSAGTDSMVERGVTLSRLASNALTSIALSLRGLEQQNSPNAAPADYTRGVDETAALIEESVYNLETLLKARDGVGLHTEVAHMTPLVKKLGALAASIAGNAGYSYWAGKDIKKLAENLEIYLLTIRTNSAFL